jgi:nicotinamide phosphoribosyltransferase
MAGFSIPAAEHSTITAWGKDREVNAFRNMLKQFAKPGGLVAVVSDSYDIYKACENLWGDVLKQEVLDSGATIVVRPDSGDPVKVSVDCVKILYKKYGGRINSKGFKVLHDSIRVIQGDGVNPQSIESILKNLLAAGYSAENMTFGMGGGLLQKLNRDTQKWAMKCSAIEINGVWRDVYKDPITDKGKVSKRGRITLAQQSYWGEGALVTLRERDIHLATGMGQVVLKEVFRDGELLIDYPFKEVRRLARKPAVMEVLT